MEDCLSFMLAEPAIIYPDNDLAKSWRNAI